VLLFDGDLGLANIDIQLGLGDVPDLGAVTAGKAKLRDIIVGVESGGFWVAAGRSGSGALAGVPMAALNSMIAEIRAQDFDEVVLDLGAGLDAAARRMAVSADILLVVATDEPTSLTDAYAVLKLAAQDRPGVDSRLVINQAANAAGGTKTYEALARATKSFLQFEPRLSGIVRRDEHVRDAIRRQIPLLTRHPTCAAAEDVQELARTLMG